VSKRRHSARASFTNDNFVFRIGYAVEECMTDITWCAGCGHSLVPILPEKGLTAPGCFWCEGVNARTMEMAKWADSPAGKPDRAPPHAFD